MTVFVLLGRVVEFYTDPREMFFFDLCVLGCAGRVAKYMPSSSGLVDGVAVVTRVCDTALSFFELQRVLKNSRLVIIRVRKLVGIARGLGPDGAVAEEGRARALLQDLVQPTLEIIAAFITLYFCAVMHGIIPGSFSPALAAVGCVSEIVVAVCDMVKVPETSREIFSRLTGRQDTGRGMPERYTALYEKNVSDKWDGNLVFALVQFVELLNVCAVVGSGVVDKLVREWGSTVAFCGYVIVAALRLKRHLSSGAEMKEIEVTMRSTSAARRT